MLVHERLGEQPGLARPALDAVAGEREGGAREANHGDRNVEAGPRGPDGVHHEAEAVDVVEFPHAADVVGRPHGVVDHRPFAVGELEVEPHRLEDREEVAEDDRRIDAEPCDGRDHHLGGEPRRLAQFEEADLVADGPVFGEVAAGLPHQPDGGPFHRLHAARPEQERGSGGGR